MHASEHESIRVEASEACQMGRWMLRSRYIGCEVLKRLTPSPPHTRSSLRFEGKPVAKGGEARLLVVMTGGIFAGDVGRVAKIVAKEYIQSNKRVGRRPESEKVQRLGSVLSRHLARESESQVLLILNAIGGTPVLGVACHGRRYTALATLS